MRTTAGHRIVLGADDSPVILHVPHASQVIPADARAGLLLGDEALAMELAHMTDAHTDVIADRAAAASDRTPWSLVNLLSRLVIDPERFPDDREDMRAVGMGAVYTRTSHGQLLRSDDDAAAEDDLLARWYWPYGQAMTDLVDARLAATGRVTVIDVHSYPSQRLPYEVGGKVRPAVCLGTHSFHTADWLLDAGREAFASGGSIAVNTPFAGCYVPLKHHGKEPRVSALMVEIRRDIYMVEPGGQPTNGIAAVIASLTRLIDAVTAPPVNAQSGTPSVRFTGRDA